MKSLKLLPINESSKIILEKGEFALLGVSPFNSYFSVEKIVDSLDTILNNFMDFAIFIPDQISSFTLEALGYEKNRINYKTRKQDNYLKNKVYRALEIVKNRKAIDISNKVVILSNLFDDNAYIHCYDTIISLLENDINFRQGCLDTSSWIITNHSKYQNLTSSGLEAKSLIIAVQYFLKELPLFLCAPKILAVDSCCFIYPNIPPFLANIYNSDKLSLENQGFAIIK